MWRLWLLVGVAGLSFAGGWTVRGWRCAAGETADAHRRVAVAEARGAASVAAAAADARAQTQVRTLTRTLIKEVPVHVGPETDARFGVPWGLVRLHDSAALGVELPTVPEASGWADGEVSPVAASDLGRTVVANYGECRADQARLSALQDWLRAAAASEAG